MGYFVDLKVQLSCWFCVISCFILKLCPRVSCVAFQFLPLCDFLPFFCLHLLFVSQHCVRLVCVLPDVFVRWFHFLLCVFFLASCLGLALVISGLNCAVGFLLCLASCVAAFFIVCSICFFFFFGVLFFFFFFYLLELHLPFFFSNPSCFLFAFTFSKL